MALTVPVPVNRLITSYSTNISPHYRYSTHLLAWASTSTGNYNCLSLKNKGHRYHRNSRGSEQNIRARCIFMRNCTPNLFFSRFQNADWQSTPPMADGIAVHSQLWICLGVPCETTTAVVSFFFQVARQECFTVATVHQAQSAVAHRRRLGGNQRGERFDAVVINQHSSLHQHISIVPFGCLAH